MGMELLKPVRKQITEGPFSNAHPSLRGEPKLHTWPCHVLQGPLRETSRNAEDQASREHC